VSDPLSPALGREQVRDLDRRAIEEYGIPAFALMENAGRACVDELLARMPEGNCGAVAVLCGPGNNGGDGLVIARTLANRGVPVEAYLAFPRAQLESLSAEVRLNARLFEELGKELQPLHDAAALSAARPALEAATWLVDALFGTGLSRALEGHWSALVELMASSHAQVLAVDLPSGIDADTGELLGAAAPAALTVSFVAPKRGLGLAAGPGLAGEVVVAEIGIPRAWVGEALAERRVGGAPSP